MKKIDDILKRFQVIDLIEMDEVKLMKRFDTKFIFALHQLPELLECLILKYKLLSIGGKSALSSQTTYYDTPNFDAYLKHHNGALNRYKIRKRTYLQNNTTFIEVKIKNNKGFTIKERIPCNDENWSDVENSFITAKIPIDPQTLSAKVSIGYMRLSLVNEIFNEKITIDTGLEFYNNENKYRLNNMVILEVKQATKAQTPVFSVLKQFKIRSTAFSKYCIGVNYLYPHIKKNNFKEKLITLNKIINDRSINLTAGF